MIELVLFENHSKLRQSTGGEFHRLRVQSRIDAVQLDRIVHQPSERLLSAKDR